MMTANINDMQMTISDHEKIEEIINLANKVIVDIEQNNEAEIIQQLKNLSWRANEVSVVTKYRNENAKKILKEKDWTCLERLICVLVNNGGAKLLLANKIFLKSDMERIIVLLQRIYNPHECTIDEIKALFTMIDKYLSQESQQGCAISCGQVSNIIIEFLNKIKYFPENSNLSDDEKLNILKIDLKKRVNTPNISYIKQVVTSHFEQVYLSNAIKYIALLETEFDVGNLNDRLSLLRTLEVIGEASKNISNKLKSATMHIPWHETQYEDYLISLLNRPPNESAGLYTYNDDSFKVLRDFIHHPGEKGSEKWELYHSIIDGNNTALKTIHIELLQLKQVLTSLQSSSSDDSGFSCSIDDYPEIKKLAREAAKASPIRPEPTKLHSTQIKMMIAGLPRSSASIKKAYKNILKFLTNATENADPPTEFEFNVAEIKTSDRQRLINENMTDLEKLLLIAHNPALKCNFIKRVLEAFLDLNSTRASLNNTDLLNFLAQSGLAPEQIILWENLAEEIREKKVALIATEQEARNKNIKDAQFAKLIKPLKKTLQSMNENLFVEKRKIITEEEEPFFIKEFSKVETSLTTASGFGNRDDFISRLKFLGVTDEVLPAWSNTLDMLTSSTLPEEICADLRHSLNENDTIFEEMAIKLDMVLNDQETSNLEPILEKIIQENNFPNVDSKIFYKIFNIIIKNKKIIKVEYSLEKINKVKNYLNSLLTQENALPDTFDHLVSLLKCFMYPQNIAKWEDAYHKIREKKLSDREIHKLLLTIPYYSESYLNKILRGDYNKEFFTQSDYIYILNQLGLEYYLELKPWLIAYNTQNNILSFEEHAPDIINNLENLTSLSIEDNNLKNISKSRLVAEFYVEIIFRDLEILFTQPELKMGLDEHVALTALYRLKELRNDVAHRFFELDVDNFLHEISTLIMHKKIDLITRLKNISTNNFYINVQKEFLINIQNEVSPFDIWDIISRKKQQLFNAFSEFGCNHAKVFVIGKLANTCIGVQSNIDFLIKENSSAVDMIGLRICLQKILGCRVMVMSETKLNQLVGNIIDNEDKISVIESCILFSHFLSILEWRQFYQRDNQTLFTFTNETMPRAANSIDEIYKATGVGAFWGNTNDFPSANRDIFEHFFFDDVFQKIFFRMVNHHCDEIRKYFPSPLQTIVDDEKKLDALIEWQAATNRIFHLLPGVDDNTQLARNTLNQLLKNLKSHGENCSVFTPFSYNQISKFFAEKEYPSFQINHLTPNNSAFCQAINDWLACYVIHLKEMSPVSVDTMIDISWCIERLQINAKTILRHYAGNNHPLFKDSLLQHYRSLLFTSENFFWHVLNLTRKQHDVNATYAEQTYQPWLKENRNSFLGRYIESLTPEGLWHERDNQIRLVKKYIHLNTFSEIDCTDQVNAAMIPYYPFKASSLLIYLKRQLEKESETMVFNASSSSDANLTNNFQNFVDIYVLFFSIINEIAIHLQENAALQLKINELEEYGKNSNHFKELYLPKIENYINKIKQNIISIDGKLNHPLIYNIGHWMIAQFLCDTRHKNLIIIMYETLIEKKVLDKLLPAEKTMKFMISYIKKTLFSKLQSDIKQLAKFYLKFNLLADANKIFLHSTVKLSGPDNQGSFIQPTQIKPLPVLIASLENFFVDMAASQQMTFNDIR